MSLDSFKFWKFIPLAGYFILLNELCERFCYYGMVSVLPSFLTGVLQFKQTSSVAIMSSVSFSSYFFAFIGAVVSDSYIGRFLTIAIFSSMYAIGVGLLSLSAVPTITGVPPQFWLTAVGLAVITIGTGGIKPCVSSFAGDQIDSAENRAKFFGYFYLIVNVGSFISMFLVPIIKSQPSMGRPDCYWGAFLLPACLMAVAVVIFVCGKRMYRPEPPKNSIMLSFLGAVFTAAYRKIRFAFCKNHEKPADWLHYAGDRFSMVTLEHSRAMINVFKTFLPMCLYWGLYGQMSSRWVYQAQLMKGVLFNGWKVLPEQMGIVNCVLVLILVPIFDCLYPRLARLLGRPITAYGKIMASMSLGVVSFIVAGFLQVAMQARGTFAPDPANPEVLVCVDGCYHMAWQLPQYFILTVSEVVLCTANLALAYAMAPRELKSLCNAMSMLTNAAGSLIVITMAKINPIGWVAAKSQEPIGNFFMWAGLCLVGIFWFWAATRHTVFPEDKDNFEVIQPEMVAIIKSEEAEEIKVLESSTASNDVVSSSAVNS